MKLKNRKLIVLGDIHGNLSGINSLINKISVNKHDMLLSVGDVSLYSTIAIAKADKKSYEKNKDINEEFVQGKSPKLSLPVYTIRGNHDDYTDPQNKLFLDSNIHYFKQEPALLNVDNLKILMLGGIKTKDYEKDYDSLHGRARRCYTKDQIDYAIELSNSIGGIDILITHEAAFGVLPTDRLRHNQDEGKPELKKLIDEIKPQYYFHGHHHINYKTMVNTTNVYGLGNFSKNENSYSIINTYTKDVYQHTETIPQSN